MFGLTVTRTMQAMTTEDRRGAPCRRRRSSPRRPRARHGAWTPRPRPVTTTRTPEPRADPGSIVGENPATNRPSGTATARPNWHARSALFTVLIFWFLVAIIVALLGILLVLLTARSRVNETVRCPSVCLSPHVSICPTAANLLLQVCCCAPLWQDISIDCCSSSVWLANVGSATLSAYVGS